MNTESYKGKTALFSGRFNAPHLGHWLTVLRLLTQYKFSKVTIVILEYKDRSWPSVMAKQFFNEVIERSGLSDTVCTSINETHFGEITGQEIYDFGADVYVAGNREVLRHVSSLDFPCLYVEPCYGIHASHYVIDKPE